MKRYRWAGLDLESSVAFPELPVGNGPPLLHVLLDPGPWAPAGQVDWLRSFDDHAGQTWGQIGSTQTGYVVRIAGCADFVINSDGSQIRCHRAPTASPQVVRELFLDLVFPMVAGLHGHGVLHASAVGLGDTTIALVGASGMGKSTLAAGLAQRGWCPRADDFLQVGARDGRAICWPSYPGIRLAPETAAWLWSDDAPESQQSRWGKRRFLNSPQTLDRGCPLRLAAVVTLDRSAALQRPALQRLGPHESYMTLYRNAFHLDPRSAASLTRALHHFGELAEHLPCFRLSYPDGQQWLAQIQTTLAPLLASPQRNLDTN